MFNTASMNELNWAAVPELKQPQVPLKLQGAAFGIVGYGITKPGAFDSAAQKQEPLTRQTAQAGFISRESLGARYIQVHHLIYAPQQLPVGLHNGVYSEITEGAAL